MQSCGTGYSKERPFTSLASGQPSALNIHLLGLVWSMLILGGQTLWRAHFIGWRDGSDWPE
jgi:hypothetical protein